MPMKTLANGFAPKATSSQRSEDALAVLGASLAMQPYAKRGVPVADVPIRVVLADDHTLFRAGLRVLLRQAADIEIIGEANCGSEAVAVTERLTPDVLVMDLDMSEPDGSAATRLLTERRSATRILILSMFSEDEFLLPLLEAGASGYLTKDAAEQELVEAIRAVSRGDVYVRPRVARLLAAHQRTRGKSPHDRLTDQYEQLSRRERDVLELMAKGFGGVEIGQKLGISNKTVETYKERIEEKLGLRHRSEYVNFALEIGLLHR